MGMDVIGTAPTSETGEYFRSNIRWWHPLAEFLIEYFPTETRDCTYWHSSDDDGLYEVLNSGVFDEYVEKLHYAAAVIDREQCQWCKGTGLRRDEVGGKFGFDRRYPAAGEGGCNACQGLGTSLPLGAQVCFSREHVEEFAAFLRDSGGFRIH